MSYELHPLSTLFPRVTGAEFDALVADIKANGLRQPIVLHDGMILDGGNRYRACAEAGIEPTFQPFGGGNIVSFVLSANLHRRHLSPVQQAAIVASAQDWAKAQKPGRPAKECNAAPLHTSADRAAQAGVSVRTQKAADRVAKADPGLARKVAHGEVTLPQAVAKVTGKPAPTKRAPEPAKDEEGPDTGELLEQMNDEIRAKDARIAELEKLLAADSGKTAALDLMRRLDAAERRRDEAMADAAQAKKRADFLARQLARCGKAVGQPDLDKVAPAVEAAVRVAKK